MKKLLILTLMLVMGMACPAPADAQKKAQAQPCSMEEFRTKQEAFLTEQAELTQDEAARFFPLYFELQDKKKALNDAAFAKARKGKDGNATEKDYEDILDELAQARLACDRLDVEYLGRFKQILSAKKLYFLQRAEMKFHRDLIKIVNQQKKPEKKQ
jgi:hypothetical protein